MKNRNLSFNEVLGGVWCFVRGAAVSFVLFAALFTLLAGCGDNNSALSPDEQAVIDAMRANNQNNNAGRGEQPRQPQERQQPPQAQGVEVEGRWVNGRGVGDWELVFEGDSVTEYRYVRIFAENEISQADLDNGLVVAWQTEYQAKGRGSHSFFVEVAWSKDDIGVQREVVSVEPWVFSPTHEPYLNFYGVFVAIADLDWVSVLVRECRGGTFVVAPGGQHIETVWEDKTRGENGWQRDIIWRTVNALAPDVLRVYSNEFVFVE